MLHLGAMVHSLESHYEHHTVHPRAGGVSNRPEQADEQTVQSLQTLLSCLSTDELRVFDAPERHDEGNLVECDLEGDRILNVLNSAVSELATLDREFTKLLFETCEDLVDICFNACDVEVIDMYRHDTGEPTLRVVLEVQFCIEFALVHLALFGQDVSQLRLEGSWRTPFIQPQACRSGGPPSEDQIPQSLAAL